MNRHIDGMEFVGQLKAESMVDHWISHNNFPHFLLVVGDAGSGKRTLSYLIAQNLNCSVYTLPDSSVDSVRQFIASAYEVDTPIIYLLPDADSMSVAAKNSLLKLTEEPPQNAYIIMSLCNLENTLPTIRSRGQQIVLEPYTAEQLKQLRSNDSEVAYSIAVNPGMLKALESLGEARINDLLSYCDKLIMYIDRVPMFNALKSIQNIKLKEADNGYDLNIVIAAMRFLIHEGISGNASDEYRLVRYKAWLNSIGKYKKLFDRPGLNRKALWDMLILNVRRLVRGGAL